LRLATVVFEQPGLMVFFNGLLAGRCKSRPGYCTWFDAGNEFQHLACILCLFQRLRRRRAILGVRLWSRLMRRTGWINEARIKRMSGF